MKPVITGELRDYLMAYTKDYFKRMGCVLTEMNTQPDHIHILFEALPQINLANFVNAFKATSSRTVRANFPDEVNKFYSTYRLNSARHKM